MKGLLLLPACLLLALCAGCATTAVFSKTGASIIFSEFSESDTVSSNVVGKKKGKACAANYLGIVSLGDASVTAAAREGGISKIATVDAEYFRVLPFYGRVCTVITGD